MFEQPVRKRACLARHASAGRHDDVNATGVIKLPAGEDLDQTTRCQLTTNIPVRVVEDAEATDAGIDQEFRVVRSSDRTDRYLRYSSCRLFNLQR